MTLLETHLEVITGIALGIEYCEGEEVGDPGVHYIVLDLFVLRFLFVLGKE